MLDLTAAPPSLRARYLAVAMLRVYGGPGSGWTAENGHVPGSQGGNTDFAPAQRFGAMQRGVPMDAGYGRTENAGKINGMLMRGEPLPEREQEMVDQVERLQMGNKTDANIEVVHKGNLPTDGKFVSPAFLSTATTQQHASQFGGKYSVIQVPAGTHFAYGSYHEQERILPRGGTLERVGQKPDGTPVMRFREDPKRAAALDKREAKRKADDDRYMRKMYGAQPRTLGGLGSGNPGIYSKGATLLLQHIVSRLEHRAAYAPDQERDDRGRFGPGDGSGYAVRPDSSDSTKVFGTTDPYIYHISDHTKPLSSFERGGIKPSTRGYEGPGVYLANTPENTQYYQTLGEGRLFRVDKDALVKRFGRYPEQKDGVQYDEYDGSLLLAGDRPIPREFIEVQEGARWRALGGWFSTTVARLRAAFDPSQARDEKGQWTDGGAIGVGTTVYRGSDVGGYNKSSAFAGLTYVSTDQKSAAQWGAVREYTISKPQNVVDLNDWNSPGAKQLLAHVSGEKPSGWSKADYDVLAGEVFIQGDPKAVEWLGKRGYTGMRLGNDHALLGSLEKHARAAEFNPDQDRDESGKWTTAGGLASTTHDVNATPMAHYTSADAASSIARDGFKFSGNSMYGRGVYFTSSPTKVLSRADTRIVVSLAPHKQLVIKNDTDTDRVFKAITGRNAWEGEAARVAMLKAGYGSARIQMADSDEVYTVVFDPALIRVKSVRGAEFNPDQERDEHGRWTNDSVGAGRTVSDAELRRQAIAASAAQLVHDVYADKPARIVVTPGMTPEDRVAVLDASHKAYEQLYIRSDRYDFKAGGTKKYDAFVEEAKAAGWSHQEILDKGIERGLISREKTDEFKSGIGGGYTYTMEDVLGGLNAQGRDRFETSLLASAVKDGRTPSINEMVNAGWTTPELERFADRVQESGGRAANWGGSKYLRADDLAGDLAYYSKDYESFRTQVYRDWSLAGDTAGARTVRAVCEQVFPQEGGQFYHPATNENWKSVWGAYDPNTAFSPRAVENMRLLKAETDAFYRVKNKGVDKPLDLVRGVGGHSTAYTPGSIESWTTDKRTAERFGKMMSNTKNEYSTLSTRVTHADVLWSWQSAAGKPGWPAEKDLKGKKEFVILGSRIKRVEVNHASH